MKERFGKPQSNGFCETPVIPKAPVMSWLKAYRFCVRVRLRLKSARTMLVSFPMLRVYETGMSKLRTEVLPPTLGNGLVRVAPDPW